jgi:transposase
MDSAAERRHPLSLRVRFSQPIVKQLLWHLRLAWRCGNKGRIRRLTALVGLADGRPVTELAERLAVSEETIYAWLRAFLLDRWASVQRRTSLGRPPKLTSTQKHRLKEVITAGPEAAGYPTGCWNSALVQDWIERELGVLYSVNYIAELLRNLGFTYQKARFVSDHLDEERRQHWVNQEWPAIVAEAHRRQALLVFADEASFAQWGSLGYTWAPRGQQPLVPTTGKRKGYKVWGLIDYFTGRLFSGGSPERFTAARYCAFVATVLAQTDGPVLLIHDGARYHTAAETQQFIARHAARLTVYQLPSYSPDYNPIEHLWRNVKRSKTHNRYFPTFEALVEAVDAGLDHFTAHPAEVKQLMGTYLAEKAACPLAA